MGEWAVESADDTLIVPAGATAGARIEINGVAGTITGYSDDDRTTYQLTPTAIVDYGDASTGGGSASLSKGKLFISPGNVPDQRTGVAAQIYGQYNNVTDPNSDSRLVIQGLATRPQLGATDPDPRHTPSIALVYNGKSQDPNHVFNGAIFATDFTNSTAGQKADWVDIAPLGGFSQRIGFGKFGYRKLASPPNSLQFAGQLLIGATHADNTLIGHISDQSAWPKAQQIFSIRAQNGARGVFTIETNGDMFCFDIGGLPNNFIVQILGDIVPLDR